MDIARSIQRQPPAHIFTEALLFVCGIGAIDVLTGYDISIFIFYALPIYAVAWFIDQKAGLLIALICGLTWWWATVTGGHVYLSNFLQVWETFVRIGFFIFVAIAAAALKREQDAAITRIVMLEQARRLENEIIEISEREQRRIGRDLHDGLCQYQAALACQAAGLESDLMKKGLSAEADRAGELAALLQGAIGQTRDLARGLVPVQMEETGLTSALEELARSVSQMFAIRCRFQVEGDPAIFENAAANHLYRIAQEAINNATRHGRARNIHITLAGNVALTRLSIRDDGTGLSKTNPSESGMGLSIMNYRAKVAGGRLVIHEPAEGGTTVSCLIPPAAEELHERAA